MHQNRQLYNDTGEAQPHGQTLNNKWDKAVRVKSAKQHEVSSPQESQCNGCLQQLSLLIHSAASASANTLPLCFLQAARHAEQAGS